MNLINREADGLAHRMGAPARQEVTFADGSALWLHCVTDARGAVEPFERTVSVAGAPVGRVDLCQLAPELRGALPGASTRDVSFAVFHSLRKRFSSTGQVLETMGARA